MTRRLKNEQPRYEVITHEDPETGDIILPIPLELMNTMGWGEGDQLDFKQDDQGRWVITKSNK
jgi:hypothetical protein